MFFQVGFTGDVDRYGFGTSTGQLVLQNRDGFWRHACRNWTSSLDFSSMGRCSDGMDESWYFNLLVLMDIVPDVSIAPFTNYAFTVFYFWCGYGIAVGLWFFYG